MSRTGTRWARGTLLCALLYSGAACGENGSGGRGAADPDSAAFVRAPAPQPERRVSGRPASTEFWPADTFDTRISRWSFEEPAERAKLPTCGGSTPRVTASGVGPLRAGQTLEEVLRQCRRMAYGWFYSDDQSWLPAAGVRVGEAGLMLIFDGTARQSRLVQVAALDGAARTPEGIGAGSSLAELRAAYGELELVPARCAVFARTPQRTGLLFRLVLPDETGWECSRMEALARSNNLERVPRDTRVGFVAHVDSAGTPRT